MNRLDTSGSTGRLGAQEPEYLRAIHDFEQPSDRGDSNASQGSNKSTLTKGDLVLAHLTNVQGWADGTILNTGRRGWLPRSFCQPYEQEYVRSFFYGLTMLWNFCERDKILPAQRTKIKEDVRPLVQGVRQALESVNCLSREDTIVKTVMPLQYTRKNLLSKLAALVKTSDRLALKESTTMEEAVWKENSSDCLQKAFDVAVALVTFMDTWEKYRDEPEGAAVSPSPSEEASMRTPTESSLMYELPSNESVLLTGPSPSPSQISLAQTGVNAMNHSQNYNHEQYRQPHSIATNYISDGKIPVARSTTPRPFQAPTRVVDDGLQAANRAMMDLAEQLNGGMSSSRLASLMLNDAQTEFFENIRAFLRLYTQSGPTDEIDLVILRTLGSSSTLMSTIHRIRLHNPNPRQSFDESLKIFSQCLNNLSMALPVPEETRDNQPSFINPASGAALVSVATICIRAAAQCVAVARRSLEETGDFEMGTRVEPSRIPSPVSTTHGDPPDYDDRRHTIIQAQPNGNHVNEIDYSTIKARPAYDDDAHSMVSQGEATQQSERTESAPTDTPDPAISPELGTRRGSILSDATAASSASSLTPSMSASNLEEVPPSRPAPPLKPLQEKPRNGAVVQPIFANEVVLGDKGRLLGGSPRGLVEHLIHNTSAATAKLEDTFFLTFKDFVSPGDLADLFCSQCRMFTARPEGTSYQRKRLFDLIRKWVVKYWDAEGNRDAKVKLEELISDQSINLLPSPRQRLLDAIRKADAAEDNHRGIDLRSTPPTVGASDDEPETQAPPTEMTKVQLTMLSGPNASTCSVLDLSPLEVARQLTLMSSRLFCTIKPADLLSPNLTQGINGPPSITAMSRLSTDVTTFVSHSIVYNEDVKKRSAVLKQWVKVGQACLALQNYDTLMAIVCSLNSASVVRLQKTWSTLPRQIQDIVDDLKEVCEVARNFAPLRQRMMTAKLPCLPFIGIFLTDLTFVDAGNPTTRVLPNTRDTPHPIEVVNFDRYVRTAAIVNVVQKFQLPFRLQEVPGLKTWLLDEMEQARIEDESLTSTGVSSKVYQQSLKVEPKPGDEEKSMLKDANSKKNALVRRRSIEERMMDVDKTKPGFVKKMSELRLVGERA